MMDDKSLYDQYSGMVPAQGRVALEGAAKLIGSLIGCSGNKLPTNAQESEVLIPKGTKVCYNLNGSSYTATLLEDMRSDLMETLGELSNGHRTMLNNDWIEQTNPTCGRDQLPPYEAEEDEDEDD